MDRRDPEHDVRRIQQLAIEYCGLRVAARRDATADGNVLSLAGARAGRVRRELYAAGLAYDLSADRARLRLDQRFLWRRFYFPDAHPVPGPLSRHSG